MALAVCPEHGAERVKQFEHPLVIDNRRIREVGTGYEPEGYPNAAVICRLCHKMALIWLGEEERRDYRRGQRIFSFPTDGARIRLR